MGVKLKRKTFVLAFPEDSELHGVEITCRTTTLGERREFVASYPEKADVVFAALDHATKFFLDCVVSWNLEDEDGNELPVTFEAYNDAIPWDYVQPINQAFMDRSLGTNVKEDLQKKSETGGPTETPTDLSEASLPMETLPNRQPNTSKPLAS